MKDISLEQSWVLSKYPQEPDHHHHHEEETDQLWQTIKRQNSTNKPKKSTITKTKKKQVLLEGYVPSEGNNHETNNKDEDDLKRAKSLTDEDLDELKGCLDLGFGFSYDEIPELCNTLPALELCYSMSQKFIENSNGDGGSREENGVSEVAPPNSSPVANWKFSSPGDHPEDVKARLKFWAQAVACTVKLCN